MGYVERGAGNKKDFCKICKIKKIIKKVGIIPNVIKLRQM